MLTPDELERRRFFVTASDVPAILGKSPWVNAADVYWQKVRGNNGGITNDAIEAGNLLEPAVLEWAGQQLGGIVPGDWRVHENGINAASLDSETLDGEPVEAKTSGIVGPGSPYQWGEAGTDQIPDYYFLQVQAQLFVTGKERAWVPALIGGRGFVMFTVHRHERIIEIIEQRSVEFWEMVKAGEQPEGVTASLETLSKIKRDTGKTVEIPDYVAKRMLIARAIKSFGEEMEKNANALLLTSLGDAECGRWSHGEFTFYEQTRKAHAVKESTFRKLNHKEPKGQDAINSDSIFEQLQTETQRLLEAAGAVEQQGAVA